MLAGGPNVQAETLGIGAGTNGFSALAPGASFGVSASLGGVSLASSMLSSLLLSSFGKGSPNLSVCTSDPSASLRKSMPLVLGPRDCWCSCRSAFCFSSSMGTLCERVGGSFFSICRFEECLLALAASTCLKTNCCCSNASAWRRFSFSSSVPITSIGSCHTGSSAPPNGRVTLSRFGSASPPLSSSTLSSSRELDCSSGKDCRPDISWWSVLPSSGFEGRRMTLDDTTGAGGWASELSVLEDRLRMRGFTNVDKPVASSRFLEGRNPGSSSW
mmetsp:Transcript_538/g.1273  ORF Transcript_538/g.1273 Transcript_538/m.1273 type:complete len:273 (-) Transcript_538:88-906(-)